MGKSDKAMTSFGPINNQYEIGVIVRFVKIKPNKSILSLIEEIPQGQLKQWLARGHSMPFVRDAVHCPKSSRNYIKIKFWKSLCQR